VALSATRLRFSPPPLDAPGAGSVEGELFDGYHDAIVDQGVWDAVQAKLTSARNGTTTKTRSEALLAGILGCGLCGCAMGRQGQCTSLDPG